MLPKTRNYRGEMISSFIFLLACGFLGWQLLPSLLRAQQNKPPTEVVKALKANDLVKVRHIYDEILTKNKQSPETFLNICVWSQQAQQWALTEEYAERAAQTCKNAPANQRAMIYVIMATALSETETACPQRKAIEAAERALQVAPNLAEAQNALGYILADNGVELPRAEKLIVQALAEAKTEPDSESKQLDLAGIEDSYGWVLYKTGRYDQAIDTLNHAISCLPEGAEKIPEIRAELKTMQYHLGAAYHKDGLTANARHALEISLFYDPNYQLAKQELAAMEAESKSKLGTH